VAFPVAYRQLARREIIDTARRYESERQGLAAIFLAEVERIEALISEAPQLYQAVERGGEAGNVPALSTWFFYLEELTSSWFWPVSTFAAIRKRSGASSAVVS
jgi:hypothetical protein